MSTRGLYGIRKKGMDKLTYNHYDSYPGGLGNDIVELCKNNSIQDLNRLYDLIELVDSEELPIKLQSIEDLQRAIDNNQRIFMSNDSEFIKNSLFCEYAYIINLDDNVIETYVGFQEKPDKNNRYGNELTHGFYPCKCVSKISLLDIKNYNEEEIFNKI